MTAADMVAKTTEERQGVWIIPSNVILISEEFVRLALGA
jgi:hypothetical protein